MTGTSYPPSLGTGGVLIEAQLFANPPFKMTEHDPTGRSGHEPTPPAELIISREPEFPGQVVWESGAVLGIAPDEATAQAAAALAQPEPEVREPSDEEIMELMPSQMHEDLATAVRAMAEQEGIDSTLAKGVMRIMLNRHCVDLARAVLARWGRPAPAPDDRGVLPMIVSETGADDEPELERIICASISGGADYVNSMPRELRLERITPEGSTFARYIQVDADARPDVRPAPAPAGEVAELVAWLTEQAVQAADCEQPMAAGMLTWAAQVVGEHTELLGRCKAAPVPVLPDEAQPIEPTERTIMVPLQTPVPISERLPGPEDCDAEGKCWMGYWDSHVNGLGHSHKTWFWTLEDLSMVDEHTHWLPHHALPKPSGEVDE